MIALCSISGCNQSVWALGWCKAHCRRWIRYGDPLRGDSLVRTRPRGIFTQMTGKTSTKTTPDTTALSDWRPTCEAITCYRILRWHFLRKTCESTATWIATWPCAHYEFVCEAHRHWQYNEARCLGCGSKWRAKGLFEVQWRKI